jgi:hypothetical protein
MNTKSSAYPLFHMLGSPIFLFHYSMKSAKYTSKNPGLNGDP